MDCINCGNNKNISDSNGTFVCDHCKESSHIKYYICKDCGKIWNTSNSKDLKEDTSKRFGEFKNVDNDTKILMTDYIHKCLMCNALSYERKKDLWCCPECKFEWGVISCV